MGRLGKARGDLLSIEQVGKTDRIVVRFDMHHLFAELCRRGADKATVRRETCAAGHRICDGGEHAQLATGQVRQ